MKDCKLLGGVKGAGLFASLLNIFGLTDSLTNRGSRRAGLFDDIGHRNGLFSGFDDLLNFGNEFSKSTTSAFASESLFAMSEIASDFKATQSASYFALSCASFSSAVVGIFINS